MRTPARSHSRHLRIPATASNLRRATLRLTRRLVELATGHPMRSPDLDAIGGGTATFGAASVTAAASPRGGRSLRSAIALRRSPVRRQLVLRLTSERTVPLAVALVVLLAGALSLGPSIVRPVGAAQDASQPVRLAVGGGVTPAGVTNAAAIPVGATSAQLADRTDAQAVTAAPLPQYVDDGTLYKPVAVDTSVQSAKDLLQFYTVRTGDTLGKIAARLHVSTMTLWWANHLTPTDQLHAGRVLVAPPVNGLIITVQAGDTIDGLAARYKISGSAIVQVNELTDTNLILGQVLIMPGAKGAPLPPKVVSKPAIYTGTIDYTGGAWHWPVVGGGNYISQYFWSGHPAIDIAAAYGTKLVAPLAGTVVFAGWNDNGGGYQVWINVGNGMYTTECHMSAVLVSVGQVVARGQEVGKVGMSGNATGPHVHFEVWIGYPWKVTSYRVNPLQFY